MPNLIWTEKLAREERKERLLGLYRNGGDKGLPTGWNVFSEHYSLAKGRLNILTGIPSHGKSEFLDAIIINSVNMHRWKWAVFSPENFPDTMHWEKLIRKYANEPFQGLNRMSEKTLTDSYDKLAGYIFSIPPLEDGVSLDELFKYLKSKSEAGLKFDAFVIDPWNELDAYRPSSQTETDFIGNSLTRIRRFARANNICVFVVAHPKKMVKNDGVFDVPTAYDIAGSAHWYNKADNILCVYRDFINKKVIVYIQKIKSKYHGKIGEVTFDYQPDSGNYIEALENSFVG